MPEVMFWTSAPTTILACPITNDWSRPRKKPWIHTVMVCRPFVSSVERRICTSNWKQPSPTISRLRTRSFTPHVSTLTVVCSSRCLARKTLSSRMPWTTPLSSTAFVYARLNVTATLTPIWRTWSVAYKRRRPNVTVSSPRTACSPWTAMSLRWTRFASLPRNMTHWLWWTSLTLPVS